TSTRGSPHNTGCREHSPDRDESSPITWRGSGESRLAPLRVARLTQPVQRVSAPPDSPGSAGFHGPDLYAHWINAQLVLRPAVRRLRRTTRKSALTCAFTTLISDYGDRRAGSADDRGQTTAAQFVDQREALRHGRLAVLLVQPVLGRGQQQL